MSSVRDGDADSVGPRRALLTAVGVVTVGWVALLLAWNEAPFALTFDDAYYYFGIARNVADGHGSTFDGINATNGYHPLWLGLAVPFYAVGFEGLAAARALLVFQMLMYGAAFLFVADAVGRAAGSWRAVRRRRTDEDARWCTVALVTMFVLLVANPFVVKVFVNGLESAVVVVIDAVLLWIVARDIRSSAQGWVDGRTSRWRVGMGLLLALAFLARTDAVLLIGCLGLWVLCESWPLDRVRVMGLVQLFGPSAVTAAVYLALNRAAFGTPVQVSGLVKQAPIDMTRVLAVAGVLVLATVLFVFTFRRRSQPAVHTRLPLVAAFLRRTGWFGAFCIVLIGYYSVLQTQQWLWYYAPAVLYAVWLVCLLTADFVGSALLEADPGRATARVLGPVVALLVLPFAVAGLLQARVFADPDLRSIQIANCDAGEWIASNLPDDAVLASWDAGVVGYFAERSVINLDGVVNSYEWHRASERGETAEFLRAEGLGWIVNHGTDTAGRDVAIERFVGSQFGEGARADAEVERLWPFLFSGLATGSSGADAPGKAPQAVFLYRLPPLSP